MTQEYSKIKSEISCLVRGLRKSTFLSGADVSKPQSIDIDEVRFRGKTVKRKRIVLLSEGCSVGTCTMCPLPNEAIDKSTNPIGADDLKRQIDLAFEYKANEPLDLVTIYTNSNFFIDSDIPAEVRQYIYHKVADSQANYLSAESLPQTITRAELELARGILGQKRLSVAIGLQSSDDTVRELAINSACTKKAFEDAINLLKEFNFYCQVFLMIKPPFLLEHEAVTDTVSSIRYLSGLGINDPILCPTRVAKDTLVDLLFQKGLYTPPRLWTVVEVLVRSANENPQSEPRVAVGELRQESNPDSIYGRNCSSCSEDVISAIEEFNISRQIGLLTNLDCPCKNQYLVESKREIEDWQKMKLEERIQDFLKKYKQGES